MYIVFSDFINKSYVLFTTEEEMLQHYKVSSIKELLENENTGIITTIVYKIEKVYEI